MSLNESEHILSESVPAQAVWHLSPDTSLQRQRPVFRHRWKLRPRRRVKTDKGSVEKFVCLFVFLELARIIEATAERKGTSPEPLDVQLH